MHLSTNCVCVADLSPSANQIADWNICAVATLQPSLLTDRRSVGVSWVRGIASNVFKRVAVLVVIRVERGLHVNVLVSAVDKVYIC